METLTEILADAGYAVTGAGSCQAALAAAQAGFDVALVDLHLPDGDGTALAAQLKERWPDGEVVLLTGHASVESAAAAVRAGACAYLLKPCTTHDLLLAVEQAMRQVRLHREKRELARRAQVAEKLAAVGTLTAGLSHEIRNPLNAAALQLAVLERRLRKLPAGEQPALLDPLALVRDEIRRLDHVLEDFLQFARPREFRPRPVDVAEVARRVLDLLEGEAARRRIALRRDLPELPAVHGDEERLRQVIMNLALNALQATPDGGAVRVGGRLGATERWRGGAGGGRRGPGRAARPARPRVRALLHHQAGGLRPGAPHRPRHPGPARRHGGGGGRPGGRSQVHGEATAVGPAVEASSPPSSGPSRSGPVGRPRGPPSSAAYSFSRYWILRTLMPRIAAAREVEPLTCSSVRRMASRSISHSVAPGMSGALAAARWGAGRAGRAAGRRCPARAPRASTTARSTTFSSSRTLPGQSWARSALRVPGARPVDLLAVGAARTSPGSGSPAPGCRPCGGAAAAASPPPR